MSAIVFADDDVDALLAAAREGGKEAVTALVRALDQRELFYRATISPTEEGQRIAAPLARLSDGSHALIVYTSKAHPELPKKFAGAAWRSLLMMAAGIPEADWLIVANEHGDWLPINNAQVEVMLKAYERRSTLEAGAHADLDQASRERLEALISEAVSSPPNVWSSRLLEGLKGRELFARISSEPSEDGRAVMVTSEVGGVSGLAQVYTSRRRPGIAYGGMTWETIVDIVKKSPSISGVQIVNDNDDWVVLGRTEI